MSALHRIRRLQLIREAEGYLDLLMTFAERWPVEPATRDRLAERALSVLARLEVEGGHRGHILYLRGQAYRIMERFDEAIAPLNEACDLDPDNVHVHLALGWCQKRRGRLDLAIQALEEALTIDDGQGIVHYNLACYWSLAHHAQNAIEYLSQAFEIDPNYRDLVDALNFASDVK